jgi:hypothetical protein
LSKQDVQKNPEHTEHPDDATQPPTTAEKKPFIEPTISMPIDVFKATTFFLQTSLSGDEPPPPDGN